MTNSKLTAAVLVDVQNIYYTAREAHRKNVNYNRVWQTIAHQYEIKHANAYAISSKDPKQRQFHHILRGIGFNVVLKPFIQRSDGTAKGDWDVGITLDAIELAPEVDCVILLSGDGDFAILLDRLAQRFNVVTHVFSIRELTANSLVDASSRYTKLTNEFLI